MCLNKRASWAHDAPLATLVRQVTGDGVGESIEGGFVRMKNKNKNGDQKNIT